MLPKMQHFSHINLTSGLYIKLKECFPDEQSEKPDAFSGNFLIDIELVGLFPPVALFIKIFVAHFY